MTEYNNLDTLNINYTCHTCLQTTENVSAMSVEEVNLYQKFVEKVPNVAWGMNICPFCKWILKKIMKFIDQCQRASNMLDGIVKTESKPFLFSLNFNQMTTTNPEILYIGPENDISPKNSYYYDDDDNFVSIDDDEIPLVMLSSKDSSFCKNGKRKKRKKKYKDLSKDNGTGFEIKQEYEVHQKDVGEVNCKKNTKKELREGFTSRMVQETNEYVVIKLTKEQVLEEMQVKSNSDKYLRSPYKCENCVKGFNFEDVLQTHMKTHTKENGTYQCDLCMQYCPSIVSLRGHIKSHTTRYKCKVCSAVRLSRQHLLEHHAICHAGDAPKYSCDYCQFTTNKRTVIQRHVRVHSVESRLACHQCGKLFRTRDSLRVHTMRHDKSKRLVCSHCDKMFIYPSLLQKHIQSVHERKDYYCVECDVKFKSPDNLRLHFKKAKRHRDPTTFKYECDQCDQRFPTASSRDSHSHVAHSTHSTHSTRSHACGVCSRAYSTRDALRAHTWRAHSDRQTTPVVCTVCSRSFTRKSVLSVHMRTHTRDRTTQLHSGLRVDSQGNHKKDEETTT